MPLADQDFVVLVAALTIAILGAASPVAAQATTSDPGFVRERGPAWKLRQVALAANFGVGTKYRISGRREQLEFPFGVDASIDFAVAPWLAIGPRFAWRGSDLKSIDDDQTSRVDMAWLDIGPVVRFRLPLTFNEEAVLLDLYIAVSPALTIARSPPFVTDGTALGYAIDVALGLRTIFRKRVGFLLEGGWARHQADFDDARGVLKSGTMRVGPVLAF